MNTPEQKAFLIEAMTTAHREHDPRELKFHSAFYDLDGDDRESAYDATLQQRQLESALDSNGYSTTVHAVLARIKAPIIESHA